MRPSAASFIFNPETCLMRDADGHTILVKREGLPNTHPARGGRDALSAARKDDTGRICWSSCRNQRGCWPSLEPCQQTEALLPSPPRSDPSSVKLRTPTRLSEQNGEELHIRLTSLNSQPETSDRDSEWQLTHNCQLDAFVQPRVCMCVWTGGK